MRGAGQLRDTRGPKLSLRGVRPQPTHSLVVSPHAQDPDAVDVVGGTMGGLCVWRFPSVTAASVSRLPLLSLCS